MELIFAFLILAAWYANNHIRMKKKDEPTPSKSSKVVEVIMPSSLPSSSIKPNCDFCQGKRFLPSPTIEKMPCPKCRQRRGMKIS